MNDYYRMGLQVGASLRRLREEKELSLAQAAELLDLPAIHLDMIERGERLADSDVLLRAAERFGCSVSSIFDADLDGTDHPGITASAPIPGAGEDMQSQGAALVRAFTAISDPFIRDEVLRITHSLARRV